MGRQARGWRSRRSGPWRSPDLAQIPVLGPALFDQPIPTYLALLALPVVWWVLFRTRAGLVLRATGEGAAMARAAGVRTRLVRTVATLVGGGFAGLAGATLVLAQVGTFAERMTAGRGYVAIAIVVLGRWHPVGVALAALALRRRDRAAVRLPGARSGGTLSTVPDAALRPDAAGAGRRGRSGAGAGRSGEAVAAHQSEPDDRQHSEQVSHPCGRRGR